MEQLGNDKCARDKNDGRTQEGDFTKLEAFHNPILSVLCFGGATCEQALSCLSLDFELTRKQSLTYIRTMLASSGREPDVFVAISHRARRQMLDLLNEDERSVSDIAAHFEMSRPAVSQHLRVLLDAGLVTEQRHGRERRYCLVPERLGPVRDWVAHYERFWDDRLQRLQEHLSKGTKNE